MNISAKDKGTGKQQSIKIESSSGLSDEEIAKMKKQMQKHTQKTDKARAKEG
ncbi:MAG: Hsp70 family protein [Crocinitomicaceae bacterium]